MLRTWTVALVALTLAGCSAGNRISKLLNREGAIAAEVAATTPSATEASRDSGVQPAAATKPDAKLETRGEIASSVVARVNGEPILASELFGPIRNQLVEAQQKLSEPEFAKTRALLIQRQLKALIDRQLVIQQAKSEVAPQGLKALERAADGEFAKQIESLMKQLQVNTEAELRRKMDANNESLDQYRQMSRETFLAQIFLRQKLNAKLQVTREELLDYYRKHADQFRREGGVRWREIVVSHEKAGSKLKSKQTADDILARLRGGANFAELALTESSGATAEKGGVWPLTPPGGYRVDAVDRTLFSAPIGEISQAIEGPAGWHIVLVDERVDAGSIGFEEAQADIRKTLREEKVRAESENYMKELYAKAFITTIFDQSTTAAETKAQSTR